MRSPGEVGSPVIRRISTTPRFRIRALAFSRKAMHGLTGFSARKAILPYHNNDTIAFTYQGSECRGTISQPQPPPAKLEYGTHAHVTSAVNSPDDAKKAFLIRHWKTCKDDKEVVTWIDSVSLSKHNKAISITWTSRIQQWHSDLTAAEQASLARLMVEWGLKLKARPSLLKILALGTILLA